MTCYTVLTYIIIGLIIFTSTSISIAQRDLNKFKKDVKTWQWWAAYVACVIFWPVIVMWAIYDGIKLIQETLKEAES